MTLVASGMAQAPQHAVIGTQGGAALTHVALLANATTLACGAGVSAHHMTGPRELLQLPGAAVRSDVVAWFDGADALTSDEREGISDWIAEVRTQVGGGMSYVVLPSVTRDLTTCRKIYCSFSCAGFVAAAYADGAGVALVNEKSLPGVGLPLIEQVWGVFPPVTRARAGLQGDGPWPVLLPGYLVHAMQKSRSALPHAPTLAEATVP